MSHSPHIPVMLTEVLEALHIRDGGVYIDGTFGAGGYTRAILDAAPNTTVIAIDRDPSVVDTAQHFSQHYGDRFIFLRGAFGDVDALLRQTSHKTVDGFVLDIGVSSMQIDQAERGFSFQKDAPLDMRMDTQGALSAYDIINTYEQDDLANVIYHYGEERHSRRIARNIVLARQEAPVETTLQLVEIIKRSVPFARDGVHPATRTFQALRISVNDELGQLESALDAAPHILNVGGRMVVVSFHSLEDRIVKTRFKSYAGRMPRGSRHMPDLIPHERPHFKLISKRAIKPSDAEIKNNPRSRSARLRCIEKLETVNL